MVVAVLDGDEDLSGLKSVDADVDGGVDLPHVPPLGLGSAEAVDGAPLAVAGAAGGEIEDIITPAPDRAAQDALGLVHRVPHVLERVTPVVAQAGIGLDLGRIVAVQVAVLIEGDGLV